ncbi:MAG: MerR family transcriptional regulator [Desulfobacterales bacterium]|nr:MAG: MerR family transcriptional regulator [Desulfobacterales bacterium]
MARERDEEYPFQPLTGMVLDDQARLSLEELCEICDISAETILDMIEEGLLEPQGRVPFEWRFRCYEVRRVQVALRLQQDLRVNLPGAALIIDLLEELDELRRRF